MQFSYSDDKGGARDQPDLPDLQCPIPHHYQA